MRGQGNIPLCKCLTAQSAAMAVFDRLCRPILPAVLAGEFIGWLRGWLRGWVVKQVGKFYRLPLFVRAVRFRNRAR